MPINGQNDLKFGHNNMYYDQFYWFWKFCQNLSKNGNISAKKSLFFGFEGSISGV